MDDLFDGIDKKEVEKNDEIIYRDVYIKGNKRVSNDRENKKTGRKDSFWNNRGSYYPKQFYKKGTDLPMLIRVDETDFSESTKKKYQISTTFFNRYYK